MTDKNLFEIAARDKFRFDSVIGELTVEQLFDLPLTTIGNKASLDAIARQINSEIKANTEESFVNPVPNRLLQRLQDRLDIVKYVIGFKQDEAATKKEAADKKAQKAKLVEALARKQDSAIDNMSEAELKAAIEAL